MLIPNSLFRTLLAAVAGVGLPAAIVHADDAPATSDKSSQQLFESLDANKDGVLTSEEAGDKHKRLFDRLLRKAGKESEGKLTTAEFTAALSPDSLPSTPLTGQISDRGNNAVPDPAAVFARLDANQDGKITKAELEGPYAERMKGMLERFGKDEITKEEFLKSAGQMRKLMEAGGGLAEAVGNPEVMFARLDANGDGSVSRDEIPEPARERLGKLFDRLKTDSITKDQFLEHSKRLASLRGQGLPGKGKKPGQPGASASDSDAKKPDEPVITPGKPAKETAKAAAKGRPAAGMFKMLDKDGDGKVSKSEAPERLAKRFDQLDANKDGFLEPSEMQAVMSKLGNMKKAGKTGKTPGEKGTGSESEKSLPQRPTPDDAAA